MGGGGHICIFCQNGLHDQCNNKSGAQLDIQGHCPCEKCRKEKEKPFTEKEREVISLFLKGETSLEKAILKQLPQKKQPMPKKQRKPNPFRELRLPEEQRVAYTQIITLS